MTDLVYYLVLFFFSALVGFVGERALYPVIKKCRVEKGGVLRGPYHPIFGFGGLIIALLLNVLDNFFLYVVVAMMMVAVLEYATGYMLERVFDRKWWDYSKYKFNLHGRISLQYILLFGVFATLFRLVYPYISMAIRVLESDLLTVVVGVLVGVFVVDLVTSAIRLRRGAGKTRRKAR